MRWRSTSTTWILCGALILLCSLSSLPASGAAPLVPLAQPSPRPTLPPTATPVPTTDPSAQEHDDGPKPTRVPNPGHITGTVIDSVTGAPAPNKRVNVGGVVVMTDANGNYDHWMPPGTYTVMLVLDELEGTSLLPPQVAELPEGGRTVVHLNFVSPTAVPTTVPTATPAPPAGGSNPSMPGQLPRTGQVAPAAPPAKPAPVAPRHLPRTGEPYGTLWPWLMLGIMLISAGAISLRAARRRVAYAVARGDMDDRALLARLLRIKAGSLHEDQTLLSTLLRIRDE